MLVGTVITIIELCILKIEGKDCISFDSGNTEIFQGLIGFSHDAQLGQSLSWEFPEVRNRLRTNNPWVRAHFVVKGHTSTNNIRMFEFDTNLSFA